MEASTASRWRVGALQQPRSSFTLYSTTRRCAIRLVELGAVGPERSLIWKGLSQAARVTDRKSVV